MKINLPSLSLALRVLFTGYLLVTSVGGVISALRLGVGLSTGSDDEDAGAAPARTTETA